MTKRRISVICLAAALLGAAASGAHAADKARPLDVTVRSEPTRAAPGAGKTLKWDASKGRWGLMLNVQERAVRPSTLGDVEAGAYYRITPSLRVGGSVGLADKLPQDHIGKPLALRPGVGRVEDQPRVRLQTEFKF